MSSVNIDEMLGRAREDSAKRIAASASSMHQSDEHIAASRNAIARSLRRLAKTFCNPAS